MSFRYVLYVFLLFFIFSSGFLYFHLGAVESRLESRERELMRLKAELGRKKNEVEELKRRVREEGIRVYNERQALEVLLKFLDRLKGIFSLRVVREVRREGNMWVVDVLLSFEPSNSGELVDRVEGLVSSVSPVVDIEGVLIEREPQPRVEIKAVLRQPFLGVNNEADKI